MYDTHGVMRLGIVSLGSGVTRRASTVQRSQCTHRYTDADILLAFLLPESQMT